MNKKLHFLLFCLAVIILIYLSKKKILEPFGNQIVIHPDNDSFDPQETTFSVLTYDSDLGSGVTQVSTCSDDSSWRNGDKTCLDYSLDGTNCEDIGSDGRLAFDACKVACDNCNTYTEVKRRLPSPIEDTDEPSYAQFEGSASEGGDFGSVGGVDIREIIGKLDDLSGKIDLIELRSGSSGAATTEHDNTGTCDDFICGDGYTLNVNPPEGEVASQAICCTVEPPDQPGTCDDFICGDGYTLIDPPVTLDVGDVATTEACCTVDTATCSEVVMGGDPTGNEAACNAAAGVNGACRYTDTEGVPRCEEVVPGDNGQGSGGDPPMCTVDCGFNIPKSNGTFGRNVQECCDPPRCAEDVCKADEGYSPKDNQTLQLNEEANTVNCCDKTGFCRDNLNKENHPDIECKVNKPKPNGTVGRSLDKCCVPPTCADDVCKANEGYSPKDNQTLQLNEEANTVNCCDKTGFCKGNEGGKNDIPCIGFYTDIVVKGKPIARAGQDFTRCCEYNWKLRFLAWVVLMAFLLYRLFKGYGTLNEINHIRFIFLSAFTGTLFIFTDSIPRWIIHRNEGKWITAYSGQWIWPSIVDFLNFIAGVGWVLASVYMYNKEKASGVTIFILVASLSFGGFLILSDAEEEPEEEQE